MPEEKDEQYQYEELKRSLSYLKCSKHGLQYMKGDNCPECKAEQGRSGEHRR
jgi:hypothetical protein